MLIKQPKTYKNRKHLDLVNHSLRYKIFQIKTLVDNTIDIDTLSEMVEYIVDSKPIKAVIHLQETDRVTLKRQYNNIISTAKNVGFKVEFRLSKLKQATIAYLLKLYVTDIPTLMNIEPLNSKLAEILLKRKKALIDNTFKEYELRFIETTTETLEKIESVLDNLDIAILTYMPGFIETTLDQDHEHGKVRAKQVLAAMKGLKTSNIKTVEIEPIEKIVNDPLFVFKNIACLFYLEHFLGEYFSVDRPCKRIYYHQQYSEYIYNGSAMILHISNRYNSYYHFLTMSLQSQEVRDKLNLERI